MEPLAGFLQHVSNSVPADIGADLPDGLINFPTELPSLKRTKFMSSSPGYSIVNNQSHQRLTGWPAVAQILNNVSDVANQHDLVGFPQLM